MAADVSITTEITGLTAVNQQLSSATAGFAGFQSKLSSIGQSLTNTGKTMSLLVTAPILAMGAATLKAGGDFEASINKVGVLTKATGENFKQLSTLAQELGSSTKFSAGEAAEAMGFLAMAGLDTQDVLKALPGTLKLAAAGSVELARAADVATNIMSAFGMEAEDLTKINDLMVSTFTRSNQSFDDLAAAFTKVGPIAKATGNSMEDMLAVLAQMAEQGNRGQIAGTALAAALARIEKPLGPAKDALAALNIELKNTDGTTKSFITVIEELEKAGASTADVLDIFGQEAGRYLISIVGASDATNLFKESLNDVDGEAARVAASLQLGLNGTFVALGSSIEGMSIAIFNSGVGEFATLVVRSVTKVVRYISQLDESFLSAGVAIAGVFAAGGPVLIAIGLFLSTVGALPAAILVATAAVVGLFVAFGDDIANVLGGLGMLIGDLMTGDLEAAGVRVQAALDSIAGYFVGLVDSVFASLSGFGQAISGFIDGELSLVGPAVLNAVQNIGTFFGTLAGEMIAAAVGLGVQVAAFLSTELTGFNISGVVTAAVGFVGQLFANLGNVIATYLQGLGAGLMAVFEREFEIVDLTGIINGYAAVVGSLVGLIGQALMGLPAAIITYIVNPIVSAGPSVSASIEGIAANFGELVVKAIAALAGFGVSIISYIVDAISGAGATGAISAAISAIGGLFSTLIGWVAAALQGFGAGVLSEIEAQLGGIDLLAAINTIAEEFLSFGPIALGYLQDVGGLLYDFLSSELGQIDLIGIIDTIAEAFLSFGGTALGYLQDVGSTLYDFLLDELSQIDLIGIIDTIAEAFLSFAGTALGYLQDVGSTLYDFLLDELSQIDLIGIIDTIAEVFLSFAGTAIGYLQTAGDEIYDFLKTQFEDISIDDVIETIAAPFEGLPDAMIEAVGDLTGQFGDFIADSFTSAFDYASQIIEDAGGAISDVWAFMVDSVIGKTEEMNQRVTDETNAMADEIVGNSIIPDMVDAILVEYARWQTEAAAMVSEGNADQEEAMRAHAEKLLTIWKEQSDEFMRSTQLTYDQQKAEVADWAAEVEAAYAAGKLSIEEYNAEMARVEEAQERLARSTPTILEGMRTAWRDYYNEVTSLGQVFGDLFGTVLNDASTNLRTFLSTGKIEFDGFKDYLKGLFVEIGASIIEAGVASWVESMTTGMGSFFGGGASGEGGILSSLLSGASSLFSGWFGETEEGTGGLMASVSGLFGSFFGGDGGEISGGGGGGLGGLLSSASGLFSGWFGDTEEGTGGLMSTIGGLFSGFFGGEGGMLGGLLNSASTMFSGFFGTTAAGNTGLMSSMGAGFTGLLASPAGPVMLGLAAATAGFALFGGDITGIMGSAFSAIGDGLTALIKLHLDGLSALLGAFTSFASTIVSLMGSAFSAIGSMFSSLMSSMASALSSFLSSAASAVGSLVSSASKAVSGLIGGATKAVSGVVKSVSSAIGGLFGGSDNGNFTVRLSGSGADLGGKNASPSSSSVNTAKKAANQIADYLANNNKNIGGNGKVQVGGDGNNLSIKIPDLGTFRNVDAALDALGKLRLGGFVPGVDIGNDNKPYMLSPGEFVVSNTSAGRFADTLKAINGNRSEQQVANTLRDGTSNRGSVSLTFNAPIIGDEFTRRRFARSLLTDIERVQARG